MQYDYAYEYTLTTDEANSSDRQRFDSYTCDERYARDCDPDVSGSWREEYAAQGVDPSGHELVTDGGRDRPDGCICWDDTNDLPCFPCARDGFSDPNPTEPESDTDVEAYPATIGGEADSSENQAVATDGGSDDEPTLGDFVTDGGRTTTFTVPEPGDIVHDRESTHGDDRLLVLGVNEETSAGSEYIEQIDASVADVNPEYDPHAPVARCVYYEEIEDVDPEASIDDVRSAVALDVFNSYSFPVDRLAFGDVDALGGEDQ